MPQWVFSEVYLQPPAVVFAVFCRPANRIRLAPEKLSVQLLEGPDVIEKGSRLTLRVRRAGISQTIELEVTDFKPGELLVEEQVRGPFRRWRQQYQVAAAEGGTRLTETIDWEPPGGLLGLRMTNAFIEGYLRDLYPEREPLLRDLLAATEA